MIFDALPDYNFLKVFGCLCFLNMRCYNVHKFDFRSTSCTFLGYDPYFKEYRCLTSAGKVIISRHVLFDEQSFPYSKRSVVNLNSDFGPHFLASIPIVNKSFHHNSHMVPSSTCYPPDVSSSSVHTSSQNLSHVISSSQPSYNYANPCSDSNHYEPVLETVLPVPNHPNPNRHVMVTRSTVGIVKKKMLVANFNQTEPAIIKQALASPLWKQAMQEEMDALHRNRTWSLVIPPSNRSPIGCKWVFKLKKNPSGSVARYKARLVAKGFNQIPRFDFTETFHQW